MTTALLLLAALGGAPADAARRDKGPEVAVVGVHLPGQNDGTSYGVAVMLADAVEDAGYIAVPPKDVHARLEGREALVVEGAALGPGRSKRQEGRILYDRADFEGAIPVLEEAVQALQEGLSGTGDPRELVQALVLLGQARWSLGETEAAEQAFSQVVVLDPARQLDPVNYPPKIVSFFNDVRYRVLSKPKGKLQLQVPDGNTVLLDGREALSGTVELIPGEHYALVTGPDGERSFHAVTITPGRVEVLRTEPRERSFGVVAETPAERAQKTRLLYSALGTHAGTQLVLLGGEVAPGQVALQLYETRTGSFSTLARAPDGGDPLSALIGLVPEVMGHVTDSGNLRTDRIAFDSAALEQDDNPLLAALLLDPEPFEDVVVERKKRPWAIWAGVGAVVAGGAAATIVTLATATGDDGDGTTPETVQGPDEGTILIGPVP